MREYDQETLDHIHACELDILRDFIDVCDRYDLEWFALAGTVLGAVRHEGFIPWDDDIDVALPAEDLETLLRVIEEEYPDKYEVMNTERNIEYPLASTRLMLKGTEFREEPLKDIPCSLGIFLDLYALDAVADDEKAYRKQAWDAWMWSHVRILQSIPNPVILRRGMAGSAIRAVCRVAAGVLRISGLSKERVFAKEQEARQRYRGQKTRRFAYLCDTDRLSTTFVREEVLPPATLPFCGLDLKVPANYEEHLTTLFGDYMQLPPLDQRKNHFPTRLDFGPY